MDSDSEALVHVFLVSFPGQGHVNPLLRLGKLLASNGMLVTFSAPNSIGKQMQNVNTLTKETTSLGDGMIRFEFFEEGLDEDDPRLLDFDMYLSHLELVGKEFLSRVVKKHEEEGHPVSCIINNPFIPWVSEAAENLGIPSVMLWIQSCACFSAYYHYHHGLVPFPSETEPEIDVQLPCMPLLKYDEIPSFLHPTTPYEILKRAILGQYKNLSKPFCVLIDTFEELEHEVIEYMSKLLPLKPVGPLFKNPKAPSSTVGGDFIEPDDCIEWLNSKDPSSVVYISFGSIAFLSQEQMDEFAYGLLSSNVSFLWVMKQPLKTFGVAPLVLPDGFLEKAGCKAKVVQWCLQGQVLAHPSVACFVTHCGWNSSMETLSSGVPVVAFPHWGDQVTNAKYLGDVFKVGIRISRGADDKKIISRDEVKECLQEVMSGPKAAEMKENTLKWKIAAERAVAEGGSSDCNIQAFVDEVRRRSQQKSETGSTR